MVKENKRTKEETMINRTKMLKYLSYEMHFSSDKDRLINAYLTQIWIKTRKRYHIALPMIYIAGKYVRQNIT